MKSKKLQPVKISSFLILFVLSQISFGQGARVIGKVIDGKTNEPIPFANVYFNGTSIGASSDSVGYFEIKNAPTEYSELVASSVGYKTISVNLQRLPNQIKRVEFRMIADVTVLSSIVIRGDRDRQWQKRFENFRVYLLGNTANSKGTRIINPQILDFRYNSATGTLTASAHEPLELENMALGYHISMSLEKFEASAEHYSVISKLFFKPLVPKNEMQALQWQKKRLETFEGSQRHFLLSVMKDNLNEQRYWVKKISPKTGLNISELEQLSKKNRNAPPLKSKDLWVNSKRDSFRVLTTGIYEIKHQTSTQEFDSQSHFLTSWLEINDPFLHVNPNGIVKIPANFWSLGYFEKLRLADQLPIDFDFWEEEKKFFRTTKSEMGKIVGTVRDERGRPIKDVEVFFNNGLTKTSTNHWGQFQFDQLPPGEYPIVLAHAKKTAELKIVQVNASELAESMFTLKEKKAWPDKYLPATQRLQEKFIRWLHPEYYSFEMSIKNPEHLLFKKEGKSFILKFDQPLVISSAKLGYQWTGHFDEVIILGREIKGDGYFEMDTLVASSIQQKKEWSANRNKLYDGSWNQFVSCLFDGKLLEHQIMVSPQSTFEKISQEKPQPTPVDSLMKTANGKDFLTLKGKTAVHFLNKKSGRNYPILKLDPANQPIAISKSGLFDPSKLKVSAVGFGRLPMIPMDQSVVKRIALRLIGPNLAEKIYIRTDKSYYYPGEKIWFKGFLKYEFLNEQTMTSKVIYIDLFDYKGKLLESLTLPIDKEKTNGDIQLGEDLQPGAYMLRAYTNYSKSFADFFYKTIPILAVNESISTKGKDSTRIHSDLDAKLIRSNEVYQNGDSIKLTLKLTDNGKPASAEYAVSIVEPPQLNDTDVNIIQALEMAASKNYQRQEPIEKPERGLTHNVKIIGGEDNTTYSVTIAAANNITHTEIKGKSGSFVLNLTDSATVYIKCEDKKGREYRVEVVAREIPVTTLPEPLFYKVKKNMADSTSHKSPIEADSAGLLDEITVKGKRIFIAKPNPSNQIALLGNTYSSLSERDILTIRSASYESWFLVLLDKIPRLRSAILNDPFMFFLNGESFFDFESIFPSEISRIDVQKSPYNAVAIYTESKIPFAPKNRNLSKLSGFSKSQKFSYQDLELWSQSSTIYWNPTIKVENGEGSFRFKMPSVSGPFKVVIEGITDSGKTFRVTDDIKSE